MSKTLAGVVGMALMVSATGRASLLAARGEREGVGAAPAVACTNFAGDWSGKCVTEFAGKKSEAESTMKIAQTKCAGVSESGEFHIFGAVQSKTTTTPALPELGVSEAYTSVETSVFRWNADRTMILMSSNNLYRKVSSDDPGTVTNFTGEVRMDGQKLVVRGSAEKLVVACEYAKK